MAKVKYVHQVEGVLRQLAIKNEPATVSTTLADRIRNLLRSGTMDTRQAAQLLIAKEDTVKKTLGRMNDVVQVQAGGGRGKPAVWALIGDH